VRGRSVVVALLGLALGPLGCGDEPEQPAPVVADELTVYASVPTRGPSAAAGRAAAAGMRRALADAGGRAAGRRVRLVVLSSTPPDEDGEPPAWDPGAVEANAERAVEDPTAIAYIGELERGGSAVSLPVTNREGLLQVAPADGLTSLTRRPPGRPRAGPERYYPEDLRTFVRLVPPDLEAGREVVDELVALGATRVDLLYGDGIADREFEGMVTALAHARLPSLELSAHPLRDLDPEGAVDLLAAIVENAPQAIVLADGAGPEAELMLAALGARLPDTPLLGGPSLAGAARRAGSEAPRATCALTGLPSADELPPRGERLLASLRRQGVPPSVDALLGYEAMALTLDAIDAAGPDREGVVRAAREPRERDGLLGAYAIERRGDVSGRAVGCAARPAGSGSGAAVAAAQPRPVASRRAGSSSG
jgi:ABC-type branched-subunit amino acid transport system substrate-binding protein